MYSSYACVCLMLRMKDEGNATCGKFTFMSKRSLNVLKKTTCFSENCFRGANMLERIRFFSFGIFKTIKITTASETVDTNKMIPAFRGFLHGEQCPEDTPKPFLH